MYVIMGMAFPVWILVLLSNNTYITVHVDIYLFTYWAQMSSSHSFSIITQVAHYL